MDTDNASPHPGPSRKRQKLGHRAADSEEQVASQTIGHRNAESLRRAVPKATPSKPQTRLFDLDRHLQLIGRNLPVITHGAPRVDIPSGDHMSGISLAEFFSTPRGVEVSKRSFPQKKFSVSNEYGQLIEKDGEKDGRTAFHTSTDKKD